MIEKTKWLSKALSITGTMITHPILFEYQTPDTPKRPVSQAPIGRNSQEHLLKRTAKEKPVTLVDSVPTVLRPEATYKVMRPNTTARARLPSLQISRRAN